MDMESNLEICIPHTEEEQANLKALSEYFKELQVIN